MNRNMIIWLVVVVVIIIGLAIYMNKQNNSSGNSASTESQNSAQQGTLSGSVESNTSNSTEASVPATGSASIQNIQGMTAQDVTVGTGAAAQNGDTVTVNYVGTLSDGTVFDSSIARNQPFTFTIGAGTVIKGWDLGVVGMKVGGERKLVIPPSLGYGAAGTPGGPIPGNATLNFTIYLLRINQ